ncbi:hypothetical protein Bcop_2340 [Bacteroides coprosuis DSM 18011]|uniref:Uncharacterized protein n=1 Tax=Bacteroides coprosuis DSM 18011 TaxID=679937 RepID=F3ZV36_9BACE|nr:hypothetical protein [Bacteroides coprosuis]EGJ72494.1 hypothetical protein Bcop_2340 [Bacteroides coprosuis DSM 18011]
MNNINQITLIFSEIANNTKPVSVLIEILNNDTDQIQANEKYAYQAFCCALLARNERINWLQKGQYIQEYDSYIRKSISINPESILARLIRLMVEEKLENVKFIDHIEIDRVFLHENKNLAVDVYLKELIIKTLGHENN